MTPSRFDLRAFARAFRHRNYRLFFGGQLVSLVGTWTQSVAQAWLVYRLTGSGTFLGIAAFCSQIPVFVLSPVGGVLADRLPRRRILVATQVLAMLLAFALAALTLGGVVRASHVFVIATLLGVVNAFDIPARQSFVIEMVGREDLMNAVALNSSMFNAARMLGPAVAGILVGVVGEGWCFFVNGATFVAVIVGLLAMRDLPSRPKPVAETSPLASLVEGMQFAARSPPMRALLLLLALVSLTGMPLTVLMPIFADRVLHRGAQGLGVLTSAMGIGALGGALLLAARQSIRGLGRVVAGASLCFGGALILFALSRVYWLSIALLIVSGLAMISQMASSNTLIQSMVPDELRGRVMALYSMMLVGTAPFGALFAGALVESLGPARTVALSGLTCSLGGAAFAAALPRLRRSARTLLEHPTE